MQVTQVGGRGPCAHEVNKFKIRAAKTNRAEILKQQQPHEISVLSVVHGG